MFEAATTGRGARRAGRRAGWVVASLAAQAALLATLVTLTPRHRPRPPDDPVVAVKLFRASPAEALPALRGAPPPPAPRVPPRARPAAPRRNALARMVQPKELPEAVPPAPAAPAEPDPEPAAGASGVVGGVAGGDGEGLGAAAPPPPRDVRLEFDDTMTRPVLVSGPKVEYTRRALENAVDGEMVVKCVITVDGRVYDCRVLRSLPFMERAVVEALERRRYRPAARGGQPLEVAYTFRIKLSAN